jgi:signal transduction histidine kinase
MNGTLRVLIVEDSENDAFLLSRKLKKGGYDIFWKRVDTEKAMSECLQSESWDVILADYTMPNFSGLDALQLLKESNLDIPFIIVSGAIGEETAVATMKAGASDYLLKDKLSRLIPVIERELKEANIRAAKRREEEARVRLEKELQQAKELAELANQRKSRVLAFVAHELKNPLNAVQTFSEILEKGHTQGKVDDSLLEMIKGITTACQHIRGLMNDILDIAPIEAGQIKLQYEIVDLKSLLLDEVRIIVEEAAKQRHIQINYFIDPNISLVRVDPKRIRQILINLLSNAIKYTHEADVIYCRVTENSKGFDILVEDHGPGIPENELKSLFLEYYRVKNIFSIQKEGLGLGLALVKNLVELHQGSIQVESILGQGTTFSVHLPKTLKVLADKAVLETIR